MAKLRKRKQHGKVQYFVDATYRGKRYRISCKTADFKTADKIRLEIEKRIASRTFGVEQVTEENRTLREFAKEYLAFAATEKKPGTVLIDWHALDRFIEYAGATKTMRLVTESMASSFKAHLMTHDVDVTNRNHGRPVKYRLSPTRINMFLRSLRAAWNWAAAGDRRYVDKNPWEKTKQIKVDKKVVRFMNPQQLVLLFRAVQANPSRYARKFEIYLRVLLLTGGRRTETMELEAWQVDLERGYITFDKTKTGNPRVIPMNAQLWTMLRRYIEEKHLGPNDRLFDYKNGPSVSKRFRAFRDQAGLPKELTLHSTRHTVGALQRLMGTPLADIRDLLGHRHLSTTDIYAKIVPESLRPVVARLDLDQILTANAEVIEEPKQLPAPLKELPAKEDENPPGSPNLTTP